ncbi:hypothetical protein MMC27_003722 [Xylographa pallens]|nr:hypothetical protein [Xylographa pallens]
MSVDVYPTAGDKEHSSPTYQRTRRSASFDSDFHAALHYASPTRHERPSGPPASYGSSTSGNNTTSTVQLSMSSSARTKTVGQSDQNRVPRKLRRIYNERSSTAWSYDNDEILMKGRAQGMSWAPLAALHLPSKTADACRKRHGRLMEKKNAGLLDEQGVPSEKLARAYTESREMMWKIVADKMGEKWQDVESKCMEQGLATLQSAACARRVKEPFLGSPTWGIDLSDFQADSGIGLEPEYESVLEPQLEHQSKDSGCSGRTLFEKEEPSASHGLEMCRTSSLVLPSPIVGLTASVNNASELRTSETETTGDSISRSIAPTMFPGLASPSVKLNVSIMGLDADVDLLSPSQWIAEHEKIQWYTIKQSFFWFEYHFPSGINFKDRNTFISGIPSPEPLYFEAKLPSECPVRLLESNWQDFIDTDTVFFRHPSSMLVHGKRSRDSQGSVQDCIHAFQNWLSRPGSVINKVIMASASRSEIDPSFPSHVTSLIKSRNILVSVCRTIEYLQQRGVCQEEINLFVEDRPRVIRLISIPLERFTSLARQLNLIVGSLSWAVHSGFEILVSLDFKSRRTTVSHHWLIPVLEEGCPENLSGCSGLDVLATRWHYLARVLDLALIAYCSSHLVSTTEEDSLLLQLKPNSVVEISGSKSVFAPASLECLGHFVQGAKIWTLCDVDHLVQARGTSIHSSASNTPVVSAHFGVSPAYVSASIESLADIWGPVWRFQKDNPQANTPEDHYYYTLGAGAIGQWPTNQASSSIKVLSNETLSHFVPSRERIEHVIIPFEENTRPRLLIGVAEVSGLEKNESCRTSQHECLQEQDLRPHGTSASTRYSATTTYNFGIGYSGTQIGVSKQYQRHPSITRKQSFVQKWTMWPDKRNPNTLLSWCGIEVSLCTRNARRRRLIHILGSNTMAPYLDTINWDSAECGQAFKQALASEDLDAFPTLYSQQVEWRTELGEAVAYLLTALVNTGIARSGDLEVYTHTDSTDPDQILTLATKTHTWAGLLKDTERSAAFAVTTSDCLSFPYAYLQCSGQRCRARLSKKPQYTMLETFLAPVSSPDAPSITEKASWSQNIPPGGRLRLQSSKSDMLKVVDYLPQGEILATWSASEYIKAVLLELPNSATNVRFQESSDEGTYQSLTKAKVYVISEKKSGLRADSKNNMNSSTKYCTPESRGWAPNPQPLLLSHHQFSDASEYSMDTTMTDSSTATPSTNPTTSKNTPEDAVKIPGAYTRCHQGIGGCFHPDGQAQVVICNQCELASMTAISPTAFPANDMMSKSLSSAWDTGLPPLDPLQKCDNSNSPTQRACRQTRSSHQGRNGKKRARQY